SFANLAIEVDPLFEPYSFTKFSSVSPDKEKQLPATQSNKISVKAGLGDTEENFVKEYGSNKGSTSIARFANDYIIAMFLEGRANNITLQFSQSGKQSRSLSDVMTEVKNILPVDAIEKERYTDAQDPEREIITFTSEILKIAFLKQHS
ncbi:hypothetical protein ACT4UL_27420, partial [Bacillus sp. HC-TM]